MATKITKRPSAKAVTKKIEDESRLEKFIDGAPDSAATSESQKSPKKEARKLISHTMPPALLQKIDEKASLMGLTRAGLINFVLSEFVNRE